ncbi:MAG: transposase [Spirochaetaceae bacterium]|nr:transposase [Spirochaetaceae bacterium]
MAACFTDYRDPERAEHPLQIPIAQRVLGLAAGYEDLNDHDRLRDDSALALASGCADVTGEQRLRERDRGHALAGSSALNRLELGDPKTAKCHRYKKILATMAG